MALVDGSGNRTPRAVLRVAASPAVRAGAGAVILGLVLWRLGSSSSLRALSAIDVRSLVLVTALALLTTLCCAWRWRLVAGRMELAVPLPRAVAACYRSQFLNTATPGGVLGDVHRGLGHGRQHGDSGRGLRSVVWERAAGQVVQAVLALLALTILPSPLRPHLASVWLTAAAVVLAVAVGGLVALVVSRGVALRLGRELGRGVLGARVWPLVALASTLAVAGHVATFVVAARTAGATAPTSQLVPLALVVLVSMGVPVNIAGWGPREGVAALVFGAAGLGVQTGVATAVVYGVLVVVASLPGALVLLATHLRGRHRGRAHG